jgi:hypothetical protein
LGADTGFLLVTKWPGTIPADAAQVKDWRGQGPVSVGSQSGHAKGRRESAAGEGHPNSKSESGQGKDTF